ncbi:hypothetical protein V1514DRAFT_334659 [Lipomyces japonicus]|uniref:uncharacterized protein n=1 Tax=Lipomyces japonicus TaxID=56871 RepID=UPI0034CE35BB
MTDPLAPVIGGTADSSGNNSSASSSTSSLQSPALAKASLISPRSPSSPRNTSTSGRARSSSIAELLATPPPLKNDTTQVDWQDVKLSSLVQDDQLVYIYDNLPVEEAYKKLLEHNFTSLPVRVNPNDVTQAESFDYSDLAALLLLVLGHLHPQKEIENFSDYVAKARAGFKVPVSFVLSLGPKDPFITVPESESLISAVEYFGSGVHRLLVTNEAETDVRGLLSQRRLIRYIWENARRFPTLEPLFQNTLHELNIGSSAVISIGGDKPVIEALEIMQQQSVSSLAVVDAENYLLGNISIVDVKHLMKSSSAHLLHNTCLQFLTVILSDRGLEDGKDSFPVFNVTPLSTLGHTIAKLVATKSHRMWIVQPSNGTLLSSGNNSNASSSEKLTGSSPSLVPVSSPAVSAGARGLGGKLIGVVSLTDVLSLLAKVSGKGVDPSEARRQRRRSSSSSVRSFTLEGSSSNSGGVASAAAARRSVSIERGYRNSLDRGSRGSIDRGTRPLR